jgi:hypothetical protein
VRTVVVLKLKITAAAHFRHFVAVYRQKESCGFQLAFTSPYLESDIGKAIILHHFQHVKGEIKKN